MSPFLTVQLISAQNAFHAEYREKIPFIDLVADLDIFGIQKHDPFLNPEGHF